TADPSLMGVTAKKTSKKRSRNHAHTHVVDSGEFGRPNSKGPPRTLEPLGASSSGGRAGTPLKLGDMTDSALIMTETGKFEANASAGLGGHGGAARREKKEPKKKLTDAEMEAKKVLLPYLDRLDYIDVELSRRNLGEERMGAGIAGTVPSSNDSAPLSSRSSNPSTARSHPETNSVPSYPTTPINIIETEGLGDGEDMFFRAPTPSPRSSTRPSKKSKTQQTRSQGISSNFLTKHTQISPIRHPSLSLGSAMKGPSSKLHLTMSKEHHMSHQVEDHPDTPTPKSICGRYYRTTLVAGLHTGARDRTELTPLCPSFAYHRSLVWVLKLIEG
ncbi:hypothetical protein TrCOL_g11673, partial [Triparma columacea]